MDGRATDLYIDSGARDGERLNLGLHRFLIEIALSWNETTSSPRCWRLCCAFQGAGVNVVRFADVADTACCESMGRPHLQHSRAAAWVKDLFR